MAQEKEQLTPPEREEYEVGGFKVFKECGRIVAVSYFGFTIRIGQKVVSNGRMHVSRGMWGIVVELFEPYSQGRTSDFINVWFENEHYPLPMKIRDLEF